MLQTDSIKMRSIKMQIHEQVDRQIWVPIRDPFGDSVRDQVWHEMIWCQGQIWSEIRLPVFTQAEEEADRGRQQD
jgi:hypothetical protein